MCVLVKEMGTGQDEQTEIDFIPMCLPALGARAQTDLQPPAPLKQGTGEVLRAGLEVGGLGHLCC